MWGPSNAAQFLAVAPNPAPEGRRSAPPEASMANPQSIRFHTNNAEREQPNLRVPLPGHGSGTSDSPNISPGRRGGAGGETLSPRQPFLMPNMDPLVRQQGLLFQQSELLREQFMKFAEAFQRLHSSVEELRDDLQAEHQQRLHSEENLASMVASLRAEVHDQIDEKMALLREEVSMRSRSSDAEVQRLGSGLDTVSQHLSEQIMGMSEGQLKMADNLAAKIAAVQDSFGSSMASKVSLEDLRQKMEKQLHQVKESADASLRSREAALREEIASIRSEATVEAEQWSQRVAAVEKASQKLCTEMANEHQQTRISAVGLATELNELRDALSKESQSYQESTSSVQRWVTETMALKQALQDEEIAQAALTHSVAENKQELDKQVALGKTLAEATAEYKSGKEELWQAMSSVEESNKQTVKDVESLRLRTQHMEVQRLGQVTRQLDELTAQQGDTVGKLDRVEQAQSSGQKSMSAKLEHQISELKQAQTMLTQLSEQSTSHEFIESKDHQYRLCVTMDGDIGIFRRSGWGKHGSEFGAVPRWHAGAVGEKALCSVNRETQSYEKDRFLALVNREQR